MVENFNFGNKIIPIECADKRFQEKWYSSRNMLNFPHSFRMIMCGPPSSGKSTVIKNILIRTEPPFEEIIVCHYGADDTEEYDDLEDITMLNELPDPGDIKPDGKKLLIIEDLEFRMMKKHEKVKLDRLFGYVSSHKSCSVILTAQDSFNVPPCARRTANVFCLWRSPDVNALSQMATRTGYRSKDFIKLFDTYIKKQHDFIMIDLTKDTPYPLRINGFTNIIKTTYV
jgi:hypothetical protein